MNKPLEQSSSVWMQSAERPACATLVTDVHADVCVVGARIARLT